MFKIIHFRDSYWNLDSVIRQKIINAAHICETEFGTRALTPRNCKL